MNRYSYAESHKTKHLRGEPLRTISEMAAFLGVEAPMLRAKYGHAAEPKPKPVRTFRNVENHNQKTYYKTFEFARWWKSLQAQSNGPQ